MNLSRAASPNRNILLDGFFLSASRTNRKARLSDMYLSLREREREREREKSKSY